MCVFPKFSDSVDNTYNYIYDLPGIRVNKILQGNTSLIWETLFNFMYINVK